MTPTSLPRSPFAWFAVLAALALPGCMQNESKTTLLADGSGTTSETVTIDVAKTKQLIETVKMLGAMQGGSGAGGIPADLDVEKWLAATYGKEALETQLKEVPGVEVKSVTSDVKDGKRLATRDFAFASFDVLGAAAFQTTTAELKKLDDGAFSLEMDALGALRPVLAMIGGDAAGGGGFGGFDPQTLMAMVVEAVGDFRVKRTFTLPGAVVETNGTKAEDGRTVTWSFSIEDIKTAGADPKNAPGKMTVKFKGDGVTLKPFKYAPTLEELTKRMQLPAAKPTSPTTPGEPKPAETPKAPEPAPVK